MSMKKRFTSLALAVSVVASTGLVGCSSEQKSVSAPDASKPVSKVPTEEKANQPEVAETHKITILAPNNNNPEIKFDEREEYPVWQELKKLFAEKQLEIEFELIAPDQYEVVSQTRIGAANNLPDMMNLSSFSDEAALNLVNQGLLKPINQIADEHGDGSFNKFIKEDMPFVEKLTTAPDGNIYWITSVQYQTYQGKPAPTCQVVNIRKDWLEKYNLPEPTTAEEFLNTMKVFIDQDANGNGQRDEILDVGPNGVSGFMNGVAQWFGLGNYLTSIDVKEGKIVTPWYQPEVKDYFKYMQSLVQEGIIDTDLVGASYEQLNQRMVENKVGASFTYCMQTWLEPSVNAENVEFLPIALLKGTESSTPYNIIEPQFFSWHKWVVTKDCKDDAGVAALLDIIYSPKYEELTAWGIEGETYEVVDGRRQMMKDIGNAFWKEMAANRKTAGGILWSGCVFPTMSMYTMESQFVSRPEHKNEFQKNVVFYENVYPDSNYCYLAIAPEEKSKRKTELITDLNTYSNELAIDLIMGNASFDKWDEYMEQLKKLGLDELMEIEQEQLDQFNAMN